MDTASLSFFSVDWINQLDLYLLKLVTQNSTTFLDYFFPLITDLHKNYFFVIPALLLLLFFLYKKYAYKSFLVFLILLATLGLNDFLGAQMKHNVQRLRPFANNELTITQKSPALPTKSFPSNHSANSFAFASFTNIVLPGSGILTFPIAFTVAYSRVYNGVHFPSDVIAGALMGYVLGLVGGLVARKMLKLKK